MSERLAPRGENEMVAMSQSAAEHTQRANAARRIYRVLVNVCGAPESQIDEFTTYFTESHLSYEWRFGGELGSGGKFYENGGRWYVGCYPEDASLARSEMIDIANVQLKLLYEYHRMDNRPDRK